MEPTEVLVEPLPDIQTDIEQTLSATPKGAIRASCFYADPGAEALQVKIDAFASEVMAATMNPDHVLHKTCKGQMMTLIEKVLKYHEFRAKLDWAKEQYYEVGAGNQSVNVGNQQIFQLNANTPPALGETVVGYK